MALEEEKVEDTTEEVSQETPETTDAEVTSDEETKASDTTTERDWKAETEKVKKTPQQAFMERKQKREEKEPEEVAAEQEEKLAAIASQKVFEVEQRLEKRLTESQALTKARSMAKSEDEAQYLFERWKRRAFEPNTTVDDQVEEVYIITHKNTLLGENNELKRALAGKGAVNRSVGGSYGTETQPKAEPKLEAGDKQVLTESGFTYNNSTRRYEKKIGSSKILIKDPKTGKISVIKS